MSYHYEDELNKALLKIQNELGLDKVSFVVEPEQLFAKRNSLDPNKIFVVVKYLASDIDVNEKTQPVQVLILAEQNSLDMTRIIFTELAKRYNFTVYADTTNGFYVKYQYSDPVVLSNFNEVSFGYRSILYLGVTLRIMENVVDVGVTSSGKYYPGCIMIDSEILKPTAFSIAYTMTPNTQQLATEKISSSVKSVSGFSISLSFNMIESTLLTNLINTLGETKTGNEDYSITFELDGVSITKSMKIVSTDMIFTPGGFPELRIGLLK